MSLLAPEISGIDSSWDSILIPQVSTDIELSQNRDAWAEVVLSNVREDQSAPPAAHTRSRAHRDARSGCACPHDY